MSIPHILKGGNTLSIFIGAKSYVADRSIPEWDRLIEALNAGDEAAVIAIVDKPKDIGDRLAAKGVAGIEVTENAVYYNGKPLTNLAASRLLEMRSLGLNIEPITNFLARLMLNPSFRAVNELFGFLEASDMPITEDGYFLAYRIVRNNFRDKHTGSIDNTPGVEIPRMERHEVDDNPNHTCSRGYHVCSKGYISFFRSVAGGDRLLLCKVDPADVVAVPVDYNNSKMRVAHYEVLKEIGDAPEWQSRIVDATGDAEYAYDDDELNDYLDDDEFNDYLDDDEEEEITIDGVRVEGRAGTLKSLLGRLFKRS